MKKGGKIALTVFQFGIVTVFAGGFYITNQKSVEPTTVYKLEQDIPMNSEIGASDFVKVEIPKKAVVPNMIKSPDKFIGLHASTKLFANQYAVKDMFVKPDKIDPFEVEDLSELRKVTIPTSYIDAVGGSIGYGDRVDLVYIGEEENKKGEGNDTFTYSKTFLQNVLVFSTTTDDGFTYEDKTDRIKGQAKNLDESEATTEDTGNLTQLTLAVTPEQSEEILARLKTGAIKVVGRFDESKDKDSAGYIIGEFSKTFTGNGLAETN